MSAFSFLASCLASSCASFGASFRASWPHLPRFSRFLGGALILFLASACAPSLQDPNQKPEDIKVKTKPGPPVTLTDLGQGIFQAQINASNPDLWVYFAFGKNTEITGDQLKTTKTWDLCFQRYVMCSNGGSSGSGGAQVAMLLNQSFDAVRRAPSDGWREDRADQKDKKSRSTFSLDDEWYYYSLLTHTITPRPENLYVVHSAQGVYYKVQMTGYYDSKGNSGFPIFRYAQVEAP